MMLRPFFSYYGSKWLLAPKYPAPLYDAIVEPFAGSAGYSLRYPHKRVVLIDKDENIVRTWEYLISASARDILNLPDIDAITTIDALHICEEAKLLIGWWLNAATVLPSKSPSAWARSGKKPNCYWGNAIKQRIASQLSSIRHWTILHGSYVELSDPIAVTWFVDPPYQRMGYRYKQSSRKIDFNYLGNWCRTQKGQVIVCENEGAMWLPFDIFSVKNQTAPKPQANKSKKEVWWYNLGEAPTLNEVPL